MNIYTNKFDNNLHEKIKKFFEEKNFNFGELQYAKWRAKTKDCIVTLYNSCKFVIQGKEISEIVSDFEQYIGTSTDKVSEPEDTDIIMPVSEYIGTDESGKGDFFGPLITAGVFADDKTRKIFEDAGIKDSKKLDDKKIIKLAALIKNSTPFSIVTIMPYKYNELYNSFKNLNKLLARAHAKAIENLLQKVNCNYVLADKFGDEKFINNALSEKSKNINLIQKVRAERDLTVAAASVIARAEFVKRFEELSFKYKFDFPKGASDKVELIARKFVSEYGTEELKYVSKTHFKTFSKITRPVDI